MLRQKDSDGFFLFYNGGLRAIEAGENAWFIEPVFDGGPCAKGAMSRSDAHTFLQQSGFRPIAFQSVFWRNGVYGSGWSPIVTGRSDHMIAPADIWSQIAGNLATGRMAGRFERDATPSRDEVGKTVDARDEAERLALSISLSLRNMDISIEQITEFYQEQLANLMASGTLDGRRTGTIADSMLYAHVHGFFTHLGAARDYLATLVASRRGMNTEKINSMSWLFEKLRLDDMGDDQILTVLVKRGYVGKKATSAAKAVPAGWLEEMTELRNILMHRRPYGDRFTEQRGYAVAADRQNGIYRYVRPFLMPDGSEADVLDLALHHYHEACGLFLECAEISGYDTGIRIITDADIISAKITDIASDLPSNPRT